MTILHFHDLRHEAVSRFFELGLSMPEVAAISDHRDPRMLFRYTHLDSAALAERLQTLLGHVPDRGVDGQVALRNRLTDAPVSSTRTTQL